MLASQDPRSCGVTRISSGQAAATISRRLRWLSAGTALGDDQLGVTGRNPGVLPTRQLSEATNLTWIGPDDQMLPRRRAARVDPSLLDPIVDLLGDDAESPGQVGDPPLVRTDEVVAEEFPHQAKITDQRPDRSCRERAPTARGNETLGVESRGDLRQVQSLLMELLDSVREASKVFPLLIPADRPSDLMVCRDAAVPNDRHLVELGRSLGHDDDALHDAAHDLLRSCAEVPGACHSAATLPERAWIRCRSAPLSVAGSLARNRW